MSTLNPNRSWNMWLGRLLRLAVVGAVAGLVPAIARAQGTNGVPLTAPDVPAALRVPDGR